MSLAQNPKIKVSNEVRRWLPLTSTRLISSVLIYLSICYVSNAQNSISELLKRHNTEHIPYIDVQELSELNDDFFLLDAREFSEYDLSHLNNAIFVGYSDFSIERVEQLIPNKSHKIIVYCSIGIRSEDIAVHLKKAGYTNVYNLFGGIFEWVNKGFLVYDSRNQPTDTVHAYSKKWSSWLKKGTKIYD